MFASLPDILNFFFLASLLFRQHLIVPSPPLGIVGEHDESDNSFYLWTHKKFDIGYNGNRIMDVNLTSEVKTKLVLHQKITFTYEVSATCLMIGAYSKLGNGKWGQNLDRNGNNTALCSYVSSLVLCLT